MPGRHEGVSAELDIVLISTADWDNPFWTNKQHVAVQLQQLGHRIFYVESQGLRAPTATARDLSRIFNRLKRGLRSPRNVRPNIWVWSPIVVPFQSVALVRAFNRRLLIMGIKFWTKRLKLRPDLVWTYSPLTTQLYDLSGYRALVYHAVDAIDAQPGMPGDVIRNAERELAQLASIIFTTAPEIQARLSPFNENTYYFSNVADFDHFSTASIRKFEEPEDLRGIAGLRVVFVGAISSYKMDVELVRDVAQMRPDWSIILIGDIGEGDPLTNVSALRGISNIHLIGPKSYQELPRYLSKMDVAIIPSPHNDYTASMFPMKFFEYISAGLPVVATKLPALSEYGRIASFADDPREFVDAIEFAHKNSLETLDERISVAKTKTYRSRMIKMMEIVVKYLESS